MGAFPQREALWGQAPFTAFGSSSQVILNMIARA